MEDKEFSSLMSELGAVRHTTHASPFGIYIQEEFKLLVHFIDLDTFTREELPEDFFAGYSQKAAFIHHRCINVWEDLWIKRKEIIVSRLRALTGVGKKIHARQTQVRRIDKVTAATFLETHHLQMATSAYYKYGLYFGNDLVAVASFSKARIMYDGPVYYRSYELERFAAKTGTTVVGGLSKLLSHFMREHHAVHVMTYADKDWSAGASYRKIGFRFVEDCPPQQFYVNRKTCSRFFEKQVSEEDIKREELVRVFNAGSIKFVYDKRRENDG